MENSSKALLIAAAVLIVILLITFSVKIFNSPQEVQQQATDVGMSISEKTTNAVEDLSSSFDTDRQLSSGQINSNPNQVIPDSTTTINNWHITNVEELKEFANLVNNGNDFEGITVYLDNDLDLKNESWTPIGEKKDHFFKGTFDGQNHYIRRINVDNDKNYSGLFGGGKIIKNLTVKDSTIKSKESGVGAIAGVALYIDNCISQNNKIIGKSCVGGIIGKAAKDSLITNCKNTSEVKTILSAEDMNETINKSGCHTGGIVGYISTGTTINGCVNEGDVTSNRNRIGGIAGDTNNANVAITNCINRGNITLQTYNNTEQYVAGIVGLIATDDQDPSSNVNESNRVTVSYCYNEGKIEGRADAGGIVGCVAQYMSLVEKCYNAGKINGNNSVGGICGTIGRSSQVINCYNIGDVNAAVNCGGIVSFSYYSANPNGSVINCYNLGRINNVNNSNIVTGSAPSYEAEILGRNGNGIIITNCITNRDEIKTNFIRNAGNNVWEIRSGTNSGYPVLIGMN